MIIIIIIIILISKVKFLRITISFFILIICTLNISTIRIYDNDIKNNYKEYYINYLEMINNNIKNNNIKYDEITLINYQN